MALIQQQESTAALKHVADQMAAWRSWKDHEEPPQPRKRIKAEPAVTTEASVQREPERKPSTAATYRPSRTGGREDSEMAKTKDKPAALQIRQQQDNQYPRQAGSKRQQPPPLEDLPPEHFFSEAVMPEHFFLESSRAYVGTQGIYTKQSYPVLGQKTKAKPGIPPWRPAKEAHWKAQPRPPASERGTPVLDATAPERTHHSPSPVQDFYEQTGILPPLADNEAKALTSTTRLSTHYRDGRNHLRHADMTHAGHRRPYTQAGLPCGRANSHLQLNCA